MNPIVVNNDEQNLSCPIKLRAHLHANTRIDDSAFLPPVTSDDDGKILTVIDSDTIKEYSINITKINEFKETKNILFDITDTELLNKTGGIVQGMSGSPIIQGDNIVGSVTHVVVDNPEKGYGIYITNMLTEAEN